MPETDYTYPKKVEPLTDAVEAGALHSSGVDAHLLRQTHALARYANGNRRTWFWHAPYDATSGETSSPYADVTAVNTWTSFTMGEFGSGDYTFNMPWRVADTHDFTELMFQVVSDTYHLFEVRVQKSTFVTSTSTENFQTPQIAVTVPLMEAVPWQINEYAKGSGRYAYYTVSTAGITLPSDRLVVFTPQVQIKNDPNGALLSEGGSHRFWLASMVAVDVKELA